jgi:osmotically-inducible protein OsmY
MSDERARRKRDDGLVIGPTGEPPDVTLEARAHGSLRRDADIARDVARRLGEHASLDAREVEVRVTNGEVTLDGRVLDEPARHVAELIADAVPGVRSVVNRLDTTRERR